MQLVYAKSGQGNFGDDLNTVVWPALFPSLLDDDASTGFVGIGTVIGMPVGDLTRLHVFSSGIGYDAISGWQEKTVRYWCVRGQLSASALGLPPDAAITDGAYLCPLIDALRRPEVTRAGPIVVPHVDSLQFTGWSEACALAGLALVDPRWPPAEVVGKIAGATLVLTESLHGAIIADAYGVPWIPFGSSRNFSTLKWADWLSMLEVGPKVASIPPPNPQMLARYGRHRGNLGVEVSRHRDRQPSDTRPGRPQAERPTPSWLKMALAEAPSAGNVLGATPAHTARALKGLSRSEPTRSSPEHVAALQKRILLRAKEFAEAIGAEVNARIVV